MRFGMLRAHAIGRRPHDRPTSTVFLHRRWRLVGNGSRVIFVLALFGVVATIAALAKTESAEYRWRWLDREGVQWLLSTRGGDEPDEQCVVLSGAGVEEGVCWRPVHQSLAFARGWVVHGTGTVIVSPVYLGTTSVQFVGRGGALVEATPVPVGTDSRLVKMLIPDPAAQGDLFAWRGGQLLECVSFPPPWPQTDDVAAFVEEVAACER